MTLFYLTGIKIYYLLIAIASMFNPKARFWIRGRKGIFNKLEQELSSNEKIAWFHCASLGEFEQGRPLIEAFKEKYNDYKILLTFYSPSGYEIRKNYEGADYIYYLPLDTPQNAKQFLNIVNPKVVFFIKYEFWYFFIKEIGKREIPLFLVSGIFRKKQRFFKKYAIRSKKMLSYFKLFFVQNEDSAQLLKSIGLENVEVTGDTRFDRVYTIAKSSKNLPLIENFKGNNKLLIAGSTWKPDEDLLIKYINESKSDLKVIIAPHEIHLENITRIIKSINANLKSLKYSEANNENISNTKVLIIDNIGLLSSLYKYGDIAYIGGGFGKGIHNILEAATFGMPLLFGPNYLKFKEAVDLKKQGGAISIRNYKEFEMSLSKILNNTEYLKICSKISSGYVEKNRGASKTIMENISKNI
jgi:3-deoxy-D-manno-octulosonic-acid transferase